MRVIQKNDTKRDLMRLIDRKEAVIGILGLGYVGLPLARIFYRRGFQVIGFDIDEEKVNSLMKGSSYIKSVDDESIRSMVSGNQFKATTKEQDLSLADCILICVPTPLDEHMAPDLRYLNDTIRAISKHLRPGQLIVLESTSFPGTTEEMILPGISRTGMEVGSDFFLAYSPEREDPGNKTFHAGNIPRVVGGVTRNCKEVACQLYESITKVVPVSSTRVAEMTKLLENIFRGVNIALVNELKILAHKMGIDIYEIIQAAATKPFGFIPFYPGPGLGGHCIPVDPFYLAWKAQEFGFTTRFIQLAGEINLSMPDYVVQRTGEALNGRQKSLNGSLILVLGVAYKPDIDDERESPSYEIINLLQQKGAWVEYNDPWIPKLKPTRKFSIEKRSKDIHPTMLKGFDAVIIITDHSSYNFNEIVKHSSVVIDTRNATRGVMEGREKIFPA